MAKRRKMSDKEFRKMFNEVHNDPQAMKEIREFIRITSGVYNLKDYGLKIRG